MKKVGILTINDYNNYGNRLQNYALQEVIKNLGFSVETIINNTKYIDNNKKTIISDRVRNLKRFTIKKIYEKIDFKIWRTMNENKIVALKNIRLKNFEQFTKDNILETNYYISDNNIPDDLGNKYNYFITGSDQVWNPIFRNGSPIDFLTFASSEKRIAYAPSIGVSEIPIEYVSNYKKWISGMDKLSIREDDGAKIIKELTGREALVLLDPTLLLTKEKWLSISKVASNKPKGKYLLTYFLGGIPNEHKKQINKIVKDNNLEIINLGDIKEKETYKTGPSEFIDYINSCSVFCTDSFHGAVFSILFDKPFIVYERAGFSTSMYSRIHTLLDKFKLESRKDENINNNEEVFNINYNHIPLILEKEREKSFKYLRKALNVKEEFENER